MLCLRAIVVIVSVIAADFERTCDVLGLNVKSADNKYEIYRLPCAHHCINLYFVIL